MGTDFKRSIRYYLKSFEDGETLKTFNLLETIGHFSDKFEVKGPKREA